MVTTLYLVRHGQTEGGTVKRYKGSIDVPLSQTGIEQVKAVSALINSLAGGTGNPGNQGSLKAVYASGLKRAQRSAELIAAAHGLMPVVIPGLKERSFGKWEGMSFDEVMQSHPDEFEAWAKDPLRFSPVGGESTLEVKDRVQKALDEILCRHESGDAIAVVAHGGVNRVMLCGLLGMPLENIFRIEQDFACLNIIEFWEAGPVVKLINGSARTTGGTGCP
ncbi:MAG: histidine phosphatase family protein [Thermodesulfovibrionales bacterium]|nr:histidine phosphatase family protein [Thermodesulfovibrionales bacterium]